MCANPDVKAGHCKKDCDEDEEEEEEEEEDDDESPKNLYRAKHSFSGRYKMREGMPFQVQSAFRSPTKFVLMLFALNFEKVN